VKKGVSRLIGLDLGASGIRIAAWMGNGPEVIPPDLWHVSEPAALAYTEAGGSQMGVAALRQSLENPAGTVLSAKRLLAARPGHAVTSALAAISPVTLHPGSEGDLIISAHSGQRTAVDAVAELLRGTRARAEESLRCEVTAAVLTTPVWFGDPERRALVRAAEQAGLVVAALINDTTATALAMVDSPREDRLLAVVDVGASGLSVGVFQLADGLLECLSSAGELDVGGDEVDRRLVTLLVHEFEHTHPAAFAGNEGFGGAGALLRLRQAVARARITLDTTDEAAIRLPYLTWAGCEPLALERTLQRAEVDEVSRDIGERIAERCGKVLADVRLDPQELDHVVVTGGAATSHAAWGALRQAFAPASLLRLRREDMPALGAATYAAFGERQIPEPVVLDVLSRPIRLAAGAGRTQTVLARGVPLPARTTRVLSTTRDDQSEIQLDAYDGDGELTHEGRHIARFIARDLPPGRAGTVQIEVSFLTGADGLLNVDARELRSGRRVEVSRNSPLAPLSAEDASRLRKASGDEHVELSIAISFDGVHNLYGGAVGGVRGVFLATDVFPSLGTPLRLRVSLGELAEPLPCEVRVSFIRSPTATEPSGIGCQFVSLKAAARRAIEAFALEREPLLCD
jgi:molecular chaperone DnaK